jgi:hypothetical protein
MYSGNELGFFVFAAFLLFIKVCHDEMRGYRCWNRENVVSTAPAILMHFQVAPFLLIKRQNSCLKRVI